MDFDAKPGEVVLEEGDYYFFASHLFKYKFTVIYIENA